MNTISSTTVVAGKISFSGELIVNGTIRGTIATSGDDRLTVGEGGLVIADITVRNAEISGLVEANRIQIAHTLRLTKTARVAGAKISFHTLVIEEGAILENCTLDHKPWPKCGKDGDMGGVFRVGQNFHEPTKYL